MKRQKYSLLPLLFALLLSIFLTTIVCAADLTYGNLTYTVANNAVTITGPTDKTVTAVDIPSSIGGLPVTSIGSSAFRRCDKLQTVRLPEGLLSIEGSAFFACDKLTDINLPSTLETIKDGGFTNCRSLTHINIPARLTKVGAGPLVGVLGNYTFNGTALTYVTFEEGITRIIPDLFGDCRLLTTITIPNTVTSIGSSAFYSCTKLKTVNLSEGLRSIESYAFHNCAELEIVNLPEGLLSIGYGAFLDCPQLTGVVLPSTLETIESSAFRNCLSLTHINIPKGLTKANNVFKDIAALCSVSFDAGITRILPSLFHGCNSLTTITIPDTVISIGSAAFLDCAKLETVNLPEGLLSIENNSFRNCPQLTRIVLPSKLQTIENYAFVDCPRLTHINIPKGLTQADSVFAGTTALRSVNFEPGITRIIDNLFDGCNSLTAITIPSTVTSIGTNAFCDCAKLQTVNIQATKIRMECYSFGNCPQLRSLYFFAEPPQIILADAFYQYPFVPIFYYIEGQKGWTTPEWQGYRTATFTAGPLLSEPTYNNGKEYHHSIYDMDTGEPVVGASVRTDVNEPQFTDKNGMVVLSTKITTLTVEATGYETVTESYGTQAALAMEGEEPTLFATSTQPREKATGITKSSKKLVSIYATINNKGYCISTKSRSLNLAQNNPPFSITCAPTESGKKEIASYSLMQGTRVIATSTNGFFPALTDEMFVVCSVVFVRLYNAKGTEIERCNTKLSIVNQPLPGDTQVELGETISIPLPKDVPIFGGKNLEFSLPMIPASASFGDQSVRFVFGGKLKKQSPSTPEHPGKPELTTPQQDAEWKEFKAVVDNALLRREGKTLKDVKSTLGKLFKNGFPSKKLKITRDISFDSSFNGYLEANYGSRTATANLYITIEASVAFDTNVVVFLVPVVLKATLTGTLEANGAIDWTTETPEVTVELKPNVELELYAGAGVKDIISGGVYGSGASAFHIAIPKKDWNCLQEWTVNGAFGLRGELFIMEGKAKILDGEYIIYPNSKASGATLAGACASLLEEENYAPIPRDYLEKRSNWMGDGVQLLALTPGTVETLQSNAYTGARPQLINCGNTTMMVYVDDDATRSPENRTRLVYSLYQNGSWTQPEPVAPADTTADFSPVLASDGQDIFLLWQNAKTALQPGMDFAGIGAQIELSLAKYDSVAGKFGEAETITENATYERLPALASTNAGMAVCWTENSAGNVFGAAGTNTIKYAVKNGANWVTSEVFSGSDNITGIQAGSFGGESAVAFITGIQAGSFGGESAVAFVTDSDADLTTQADQRAYLWTAGAAAVTAPVADTPAYRVFFTEVSGAPALAWYDGKNLQYITPSNSTPTQLLTEDVLAGVPEAIVTTADHQKRSILYTQNEKNTANLYAITYDSATSSWGLPVAITQQNRYLERTTATYVGQDLVAAFQCNTVNPTALDKTTDLCWMIAKEEAKLELVRAFCNDTQLLPGGEAHFVAEVRNAGSLSSKATSLTVTAPDGTVLPAIAVPVIGGGENWLLETTVTLPQTLTGANYQLALGESKQVVALGCADLAVEAETYQMGEKNIVLATVTNQGGTAAAATLIAEYPADVSIPSQEVAIRSLAPGESAQVTLTVDRDFFRNADVNDLTLRILSPEAQNFVHNDQMTLSLRKIYSGLNWDAWSSSTQNGLVQLSGSIKNSSAESVTGKVVLAAYDSVGKLLYVSTEALTLLPDGTKALTLAVADAAVFKAFFLQNDSSLTPLLEAAVIPVTQS